MVDNRISPLSPVPFPDENERSFGDINIVDVWPVDDHASSRPRAATEHPTVSATLMSRSRGYTDIPPGAMEGSWNTHRSAFNEGGTVISVQGGSTRAYTEGSMSIAPRGMSTHTFHRIPSVSSPIGDGGFTPKAVTEPARPMQGIYIAKTAVGIAGCYLAIQLLITFEEVLLPFIFAVLLMIVLEPLKKFVMRTFNKAALKIFQKLHLNVCIEKRVRGAGASTSETAHVGRTDDVISEAGYISGIREDSTVEEGGHFATSENMHQYITTSQSVQKIILIISIIFCICITGRVLWLTAKVFIKAGTVISTNLIFYRKGADRLKEGAEEYVRSLNISHLKFARVLDDIVKYLEVIGSLVGSGIMYTLLQSVVAFIFLIYMMWSPVKMDSNTTTQEVFISTGKYLKVKCLISAFTGLCVCISLWAIGLDLPAAFGFLAFLCNFLPGLGSAVASVLPCVLAMMDSRKTPGQVLFALLTQLIVHFFVDFVVEPVFFGISVEVHSVVVILGIWFFYKVWGVAGMLLSVPLLAVVRLLLKSFKTAAQAEHGRDAETLVFLDNILEGRWMTSVGDGDDRLQVELPEMSIDQPHGMSNRETTPFGAEEPEGEGSPASFWESVLQSQAGKIAKEVYTEYRLLIDIALLVGLVIALTFVPL